MAGIDVDQAVLIAMREDGWRVHVCHGSDRVDAYGPFETDAEAEILPV
ncbi:hypothetical protein [Algihabitans albus]|nr:hypothetical protein [Algihabitans albus]